MSEPVHWGADVPVSLPQPLNDDNPAIVAMDGFCFTTGGIAFDMSQADYDRIAVPTFAPDNPGQPVVNYDEGL